MNWIMQNIGTIVVAVILIIITGMALRNVMRHKNGCHCGSCNTCSGCHKRKEIHK